LLLRRLLWLLRLRRPLLRLLLRRLLLPMLALALVLGLRLGLGMVVFADLTLLFVESPPPHLLQMRMVQRPPSFVPRH